MMLDNDSDLPSDAGFSQLHLMAVILTLANPDIPNPEGELL